MQVAVAEQDARVPTRPPVLRDPWTVSALTLAVAVPVSIWVLVPRAEPVAPVALFGAFLALLAADWINLHLEFRRQSVSCSLSELAFVIALVEVGGTWTAIARIAAVVLVLVVKGTPRSKLLFNIGLVDLEVCTAVAVLGVLSVDDTSSPATWLA